MKTQESRLSQPSRESVEFVKTCLLVETVVLAWTWLKLIKTSEKKLKSIYVFCFYSEIHENWHSVTILGFGQDRLEWHNRIHVVESNIVGSRLIFIGRLHGLTKIR